MNYLGYACSGHSHGKYRSTPNAIDEIIEGACNDIILMMSRL